MTTKNPGINLVNRLMKMFPLMNSGSSHTLEKLDMACDCGGELVKTLYITGINYTARRIVTQSRVLHRRAGGGDPFNNSNTKTAIKKYLCYTLNFELKDAEELSTLCLGCIYEAEKSSPITRAVRETVIKHWKESRKGCGITGQKIEYGGTTSEDPIGASLDHTHPQSLGGSSYPNDLKLSRHEFNQIKENILNECDLPFSSFCIMTESADLENVTRQFTKEIILAALLRSGSKCWRCSLQAEDVGQLSVVLEDKLDCGHFFNLIALCPSCQEKIK